MNDKFLTNYQEDDVYYVVVDDEDEIYQKFRNIKEATAYFNEMKEIYQHTPKTFFLSLVRTNVIIKK